MIEHHEQTKVTNDITEKLTNEEAYYEKKFTESILLIVISFVLLFSVSIPANASSTQSITIDGVVYTVTMAFDLRGDKVVTGEGDGYIATVTVSNARSNFQSFEVRTKNIHTDAVQIDHIIVSANDNIIIESKEIEQRNMQGEFSQNMQSVFPPLSIDYSATRSVVSNGVRFVTWTSNKIYIATCRNNMTARAYGDRFFQAVQRIYSNEISAISAIGVATASSITAKLTAAIPIAAIVALVVAAGGLIASVPFFVYAHMGRGDARHYQARFIAALR